MGTPIQKASRLAGATRLERDRCAQKQSLLVARLEPQDLRVELFGVRQSASTVRRDGLLEGPLSGVAMQHFSLRVAAKRPKLPPA
jgi:hypothetical protein